MSDGLGQLPPVKRADEWFKRFPNGGTVYQRRVSGGETGTAGDPSKK